MASGITTSSSAWRRRSSERGRTNTCERCERSVPSKFFGFVDERPLRSPQPATKVAGYLSKYLAKWREDGTLEVSETVLAAGRTLLNYVSRKLTARSGCTMRSLRMLRVAWAFREGLIPQPMCDPFELLLALCELERRELAVRGP